MICTKYTTCLLSTTKSWYKAWSISQISQVQASSFKMSFTGCTSEKRRFVRTRRTPPQQSDKAYMSLCSKTKPLWLLTSIDQFQYWSIPMLFRLPWNKWKLLTSDSDFPNFQIGAPPAFRFQAFKCLKDWQKYWVTLRSLWLAFMCIYLQKQEQQQTQHCK